MNGPESPQERPGSAGGYTGVIPARKSLSGDPPASQSASGFDDTPPAERLRRAADLIEQHAATCPTVPWESRTIRANLWPWVALMGPQVAAPLAAWLRHPASTFDEHALALADVILGGAS